MVKVTKKALKTRCSEILNNTPAGVYLCGDDKEFMISILENHHEWSVKKGDGVTGVFIGRNAYGGKCFWLRRVDGSATDISFHVALDGRKNKRAEVVAALRTAVMPVVQDFKNTVNFYFDKCPFTGETLTPMNTHIDHYDKKFREVVDGWLSGKDIDTLHSWLNPSGQDGNTTIYFINEEIVQDFTQYHNANTHLRAVSEYANLNILK